MKMDLDQARPGRISFRWYLVGVIILIILLVLGVILHSNYQSAKDNLENDYLSNMERSEYTLIQSVLLVDRGLLLFDRSLDYKLAEPMDQFLQAYAESGGDPGQIDLNELLDRFGDGYELYIINAQGVVEYTTYEPDLFMDFSAYPVFFDRLTEIREGNIFVTDRVTQEFATGLWRKYVYHPTPDHRYILEISYMDEEIQKIRSALRFTEAATEVREMNPYLTSIRIFNWLGDEVGNASYVPEDYRTSIITDVWQTGEPVTLHGVESHSTTRYVYIDLSGDGNPREMSLVAEMTYTTVPIREELNTILFRHLMIAFSAVVIGSLLAVVTTNTFVQPINHLVEDTEVIAKGSLDHPIRLSRLPELHSLSLSVQVMVDRLREMMARLQVSEEELLTQNEVLDLRVRERTHELEEALSRKTIAEKRYSTLFREMPDGFVECEIVSGTGGRGAEYRILAANPAFQEMLLIPEDEVSGSDLSFILADADDSLSLRLDSVAATGEPVIFEVYLPSCERHVKISAFRSDQTHLACICEDITEEKMIRGQITKSLEEKEVLIKEIHHRVKNNMQVISSLLMLQRKRITDPQIREQFLESESRIFSLALVHEKLYQSGDFSRIHYGQYLSMITDYILSSREVQSGSIDLEIEASGIYLSIEKAVPLSLITTELLTNALKHAFPDGRKGQIRISIERDGGRMIYVFSDNGVGFPEDLDYRMTQSLGMQLVNNLVMQLMGTLSMKQDGGTTFIIEFPGDPDRSDSQ